MNEEENLPFKNYNPFVNPPPHPKSKKKKKPGLLCKIFGHKYIDIAFGPGVIEPTCKRCGHERDVSPPKKKPENEQNTEKLNTEKIEKECDTERRGKP